MYLSAENAKIYRAVMIEEDAALLHDSIDALWNWTEGSLSKFTLSNCQQLTLAGRSKRPARNYTIDGNKPLTSVDCEKDIE